MAPGVRFVVDEDLEGDRLDRAVAVLGEMSRAAARDMVERGEVTLGGEAFLQPSRRVVAGDELVFPPRVAPAALTPEPVDFEVVYADANLLVVDKPPGLVMHPGSGPREGTLAAGILNLHPEVEGVGEEGRWGLVHRLDRDTSGLLVVALDQPSWQSLSAQVRQRTMGRRYLALVDGAFEIPTGTVDAPVGRDPVRPTRRIVTPEGRPARTHYTRVESFPASGLSLVELRLDTGRTHQIRVHMAAIHHPVVGDRTYRPGPDRVAASRIFLHASGLSFDHPRTGERMRFTSDLPGDLAAILSGVRRGEVPG